MLKLLSFKVNDQTHAKISSVAKFITTLAFLAVMMFFMYTGFKAYKDINSLGSDYATVTANLILNKITENTSRGKSLSDTYHYDYSYRVNQQNYTGSFKANDNNLDSYYDQENVEIAYSSSNPSQSKRLSIVEKGYSLTSYILRMFFIFLFVGFFSMLIFGFITEYLFINKDAPTEENEDE